MSVIKEHERVVLTADIPQEGLTAEDVGTVVPVYRDGVAFEVEFVALDGETIAIATVERSHGHPAARREITHAPLTSAPVL